MHEFYSTLRATVEHVLQNNFLAITGDMNSKLQPFTEIIGTNAKNGLVPISNKQCNALFGEHIVRLNIISLYIYI